MHEDLKRLIENYRGTAIVPDAEVLGVIVAQYFDWDGWKICQAFMSALEESNFHSLNSRIAEVVDKEGFISGKIDARELNPQPTVAHRFK
jgi:hypothetical protein